jgi:AcrR family transcriptional regulator
MMTMPENVKRRAYSSPARRRQSEATRERLLAAAHDLFLANGYRSTTTAAIAGAAGVSEASVFVNFGSKSALLIAVVGAAAAGSPDDVALRDRPAWRALTDNSDKRKAVAEFVGLARRAHERTWRLLELVRVGAESDPDLAAMSARGGQDRRADCAWFVTVVLGKTTKDTRTAELIDVVWAQSGVDLYRLLVIERGWTSRHYERWLTEHIYRQLGTV